MAVGLASATCDNILKALGNNTTWTAGATLAIQLHTADPGSAGTTSPATPVSGHGAGTRQTLTFGTASSNSMTNSVACTWTNVFTSEQYSHFSVWDNATYGSGNFLFSGTVTANPVNNTDTFTIAIAGLTASFTKAA